jgi:hypothetical protein
MAAGLGFKDFATGEVLTAADVDGYLMQGVWVFASAAARDAAVTSPQEGNFAYLKDTNVTTYYTGSAWANLDTTGMTNPMTTTGDIIYSSSGSTPARLGIGTAGQVLKVNSGATAPEWGAAAGASGLTLVKTQTIETNVTSVAVTSAFSSTYDNYFITVNGGTNTGHGNIKIQLGATTSAYHIGGNYMSYTSNTINGYAATNDSNWYAGKHSPDDNYLETFLHNPNLAKITEFTARAVGGNNASGGITNYQGFLNNTTQYTDFTLIFDTASTGGTIRVYGLQNS